MKRSIQGSDRTPGNLLPEQLDDYVTGENPVRVVSKQISVETVEQLIATVTISDVAKAVERWRLWPRRMPTGGLVFAHSQFEQQPMPEMPSEHVASHKHYVAWYCEKSFS